MRTGQIELDALMAAVVISTAFLAAASVQHSLLENYYVYTRYQALVLDVLRYSDFLLYSSEGLAVEQGGLVLDHVVDCGKVPQAFERLKEMGFDGYISCSFFYAGSGPVDVVLRRRAIWNGFPVTVEVGLRASDH